MGVVDAGDETKMEAERWDAGAGVATDQDHCARAAVETVSAGAGTTTVVWL